MKTKNVDANDDSGMRSVMTSLPTAARRCAKLLTVRQQRVVFAESCTGGLVAATLAAVPGISDLLCGSAVTYRNDTKHQWLGVFNEKLKRPGAVSRVVAEQMASGVLQMTPEADWAASITGHLGPHAPKRLDGLVYIGLAHRLSNESIQCKAAKHVLSTATRIQRQREAAALVIDKLHEAIGALA